jgi:hypothetical protein
MIALQVRLSRHRVSRSGRREQFKGKIMAKMRQDVEQYFRVWLKIYSPS